MARSALLQARLASTAVRALPDFLLIGAQKCGTTSFFHALTRHPDVSGPLFKEVHYFDRWYDRGEGWYRAHFPREELLRQRREGAQHAVTGEASPDYLHHPSAPARVRELLPDVRLVVLLRNPVDRAASHWAHQRARGREPLSFEEALAREDERIAAGEIERFAYRTRGLYLRQLEWWAGLIPRDRLMVLCAERFFAAPAEVYARALEFLGLPAWRPKGFAAKNVGPRHVVPDTTRQELFRFYEPHNRELFDWLGEEMPWR